jgi:hypothetical protein
MMFWSGSNTNNSERHDGNSVCVHIGTVSNLLTVELYFSIEYEVVGQRRLVSQAACAA